MARYIDADKFLFQLKHLKESIKPSDKELAGDTHYRMHWNGINTATILIEKAVIFSLEEC